MSRVNQTKPSAPPVKGSAFKKLKPGPGLSRKAVAMDQQMRLRVALVTLMAELGFAAVTVRALIGRAGVSTSTFYNHFDSVEACLAGIVAMTIQILVGDIEDASRHGTELLDGMHAGLRHLTSRLSREPALAQAVFIEAFAAGPQVRKEMADGIGKLERLVTEALASAPRPVAGTTHLAAGVVAGLFETIRRTSATGRCEELPRLTDELMDWTLSVGNEEVVTFCNPRSRPVGRDVGDRLPQIDAVQTSRESVADASRRATMTAARLAAANGLTNLTDVKIRKDAGLSRREFEEHFTGVEDCFVSAVDSTATLAAAAAERSAGSPGSWAGWTYRVMAALSSRAATDRDLARLVLLDITAAGPRGVLRRTELIERTVTRIRHLAPAERRPSEVSSAASVSAIWRIAETEVSAGRTSQLPRLAPVFTFMILASRRSSRSGSPTESRAPILHGAADFAPAILASAA